MDKGLFDDNDNGKDNNAIDGDEAVVLNLFHVTIIITSTRKHAFYLIMICTTSIIFESTLICSMDNINLVAMASKTSEQLLIIDFH